MAVISSLSVQGYGRVIRLVHNDPNIATAVELGFDRLVVERSIDMGLTWEEITTPADRPQLIPTQVDYVYVDRKGDTSYQYRTRYYSTTTCDLTDPSPCVDGTELALSTILTPAQLIQRYLFGIDLTDDAGNPLPESVFNHYILAAIEWLEQTLDIYILPTQIIDEREDYMFRNYQAWSIIQLENYPVVSLERFAVQYPSANEIVAFPLEWMRLDKTHGILRIVPSAGTLSEILITRGGGYLPAIYSGGLDYLPDLFSIDYTAGFDFCQVPRNIVDIIGKVASMGPFNIFGDLIAGAGIATTSLSIDGLSQNIATTSSATNAGYGARLGQYEKEVKAELPRLIAYYKGIRMSVA